MLRRLLGRYPERLLLAVLGFGLVMATITEPGLTIDESINVTHGKTFFYLLTRQPMSLFSGGMMYQTFKMAHEHPPLTRFLLGVSHALFDGSPKEPQASDPLLGRPGSALFFGAIIWLGMSITCRLMSRRASILAGTATMLMPRLFAHAHFAAPEVIHAYFVLLALAVTGWQLDKFQQTQRLSPSIMLGCVLAGLALGLALLTKLTAVLIPVSIGLALLVRRDWRGLVWCLPWGLLGIAVLVLGFPWFWPFDFPDGAGSGLSGTFLRLLDFASVGVKRATIYTWYMGQQFPTETAPVPWHYVLVHLLLVTPFAWLILALPFGFARIVRKRTSHIGVILGCHVIVTLLFFAGPIGKYDQERLVVFLLPIMGIMIGAGFDHALRVLSNRFRPQVAWPMVLLFLGWPIVDLVRLHPIYLSYFNLAAGGLPGSVKLGLESNYWGDAVTSQFLDQCAKRVPPKEYFYLFPTLHSGHAVRTTSISMLQRQQRVMPGHMFDSKAGGWVIMFRRQSYLHDPLPLEIAKRGQVEISVEREGVWLARLLWVPPASN